MAIKGLKSSLFIFGPGINRNREGNEQKGDWKIDSCILCLLFYRGFFTFRVHIAWDFYSSPNNRAKIKLKFSLGF